MSDTNTFGDYIFNDWVPERTKKMIVEFWGCFGRTYLDWVDNCNEGNLYCVHGPVKNGFKWPKNGDTADYIIRDFRVSKQEGRDLYKIVRGRYIHRWNNMGSLIDEFGEDHCVSSCDRWVRVLVDE